MQQGQQGYNFEAQPRTVQTKAKFRDEREAQSKVEKDRFHNIMFDRRVVRGNTYSSNMVRMMPTDMNNYDQNAKTSSNQQTGYGRQQQTSSNQGSHHMNTYSMTGQIAMTPRDLEGLNSISTMTEEYIEVLSDKPEQRHQEAQTDFQLNKPAVLETKNDRHYYRLNANDKKSISTQIVEDDLLFDFNTEVESILTVLKTKVLEQSRMEVLEEEELAIMKDQHRKYIQLKNAELAEVQRLEANERRISEETGRRIIQNSLITGKGNYLGKNISTHRQLACRVVSKNFMRSQEDVAINVLDQLGFFSTDAEIQLHSSFVPWLYDEIYDKLEKQQNTIELSSRMMGGVENHLVDMHICSLDNKKRKEDQIEEAKNKKLDEKAAKRQKKKAEREDAIEAERIEKLHQLIKSKMIRENINTKTKPLLFGDIISSQETDQREIVGLPGGLLMEMYSVFEAIRLFNESTGRIGTYNLEEAFVTPFIRLFGEWFLQSEWSFEVTYDPEIEEKLKEIMPEVNLKDLSTLIALNNPENKEKKEEYVNTLADGLTSALLYFLKKLDCLKYFSKDLIRNDEPLVDGKPSNTEQDGMGKDSIQVSDPTNKLGFSYKINENALKVATRGLANFLVTEDHEKYSKYLKLAKSRAKTLDLQNFPALCIICPEFEDPDEVKQADQDEPVDAYKQMLMERFPKPEEEKKDDEVQKPKGLHEQKYESKATPVNTNHNDQKVVVNHKVMSVTTKKEMVQAALQVINNKLAKDKELCQAILGTAMEVGEFIDDGIWKKLGAKLDIQEFKHY